MTPTSVATPGVAGLRRRVGPVAWCALECLIERADGRRIAAASVRAIAADLGVAKNTAHRAIAALTRAGLIEPEQERSADGRFQRGRYVLHLADLLDAPPAPPATRARRRNTSAPSQLSLLAGE